MSLPKQLTLPCQHGALDNRCWDECPGGRVVEPDIEAIKREMWNRRVDRYIDDPEIFNEAAEAFAAAYLGLDNE